MLGVLEGVGLLGPWSSYNHHMNYSNQTMEANQGDFIMAGRICRAGRALCVSFQWVEAFYVTPRLRRVLQVAFNFHDSIHNNSAHRQHYGDLSN